MIFRQNNIREFVEDFYISHKYPPSVRAIQTQLGIKSTSTVFSDLLQLVERGELTKDGTHILPVFTPDFIKRLGESYDEN